MTESTSMKMKLLPWVAFHPNLHLMVARPCGVLNEAQIEETVAMVEAVEEQANRPFNRFCDLSQLEAVDLSFEIMFRISLHRRLTYANNPAIKSAFYAKSPAAVRIVKTHVLLTDHSPLEVKMFTELEAAAQWLEVTVADLQLDL